MKNSYNSTAKEQKQQKNQPYLKKWVDNLKGYFAKDDTQITNKHMKRCSTSLIIREMQIKTTMVSHLISFRKAIIKGTRNNKVLVRM